MLTLKHLGRTPEACAGMAEPRGTSTLSHALCQHAVSLQKDLSGSLPGCMPLSWGVSSVGSSLLHRAANFLWMTSSPEVAMSPPLVGSEETTGIPSSWPACSPKGHFRAQKTVPDKVFVKVLLFSCLVNFQLFCNSRTAACQAPLSVGFPRQQFWSEFPLPSQGNLPNLEIEPLSPMSLALT